MIGLLMMQLGSEPMADGRPKGTDTVIDERNVLQ